MNNYQAVDIPVNAWIIQTKEEADDILLRGGKLILMTEEVPSYLGSPHYGTSCLMASVLLPDYKSISYYLDNNMEAFSQLYTVMLSNQECTIYFVTIISAIMNNIPLGFVFGNEEIEVASSGIFLNYLCNMYGISLGHHYPFLNEPGEKIGFMLRAYIPKNTSLLYLNNLLTPQEFLYVYPQDMLIDDNSLTKLVMELKPPVKDVTDRNEVQAYFTDFMRATKKANKVLIDPMVMA